MAILARRFAPSEFGKFAYSSWLVDMSFMVCSLGLNASGTRFLAEYAHDGERRRAFVGRWFPLAIAMPVAAGMLSVAGALGSGLKLECKSFWLLGAWGTANGWWNMQMTALLGGERFASVLRGNLVFVVVTVFAALATPLGALSLGVMLGVMLFASTAAMAFTFNSCRSTLNVGAPRAKAEPQWSRVRAYSLNMWVAGTLGALVWSRGEFPVVRVYTGDDGVAAYSVALTVFFGSLQGVMLWVSGITPHLTSLWAGGSRSEAAVLARRFSDVQLMTSAALAVLLTCFGSELLRLAFGPASRRSYPELAVLASGLLTVSFSAQNVLLQVVTDARFSRNVLIAGMVFLYAIALIVIPLLGTLGAAISRAFTMWLMLGMTVAYCRRTLAVSCVSLRNLSASVAAVAGASLAALISAGSLTSRTLVALGCWATLALSLRTHDGHLVAMDAVTVVFPKLRGRSARPR